MPEVYANLMYMLSAGADRRWRRGHVFGILDAELDDVSQPVRRSPTLAA
ncbi:MAG TPA: hypothetical protein VFQ37_04180 [Mycobacterium sp.]|nr:hypothetical protein [Mycobacterium sp.]